MLDEHIKSIDQNISNKKPKLWAHQETAKNLALQTDGFGLFMEMGTGKTATTIHILNSLYREHGMVLRTLILCPPIVIRNWRNEFLAHSDPHIYENTTALVGPGKDRVDALLNDKNHNIFITNYESFTVKGFLEAVLKNPPKVFILDEIHKIKDPKAKRTKACVQIADRADYRYGLTGSPILNSLQDVYSLFRVIDRGATFGKSFYVFQATYFYNANANKGSHVSWGDWRPKPGATEQINSLIKKRSFVVTKKECLDLPPLVRKTVEVPLTPEQQRHYDSMRKDLITYVNGGACLAKIALTKSLRLLQIVSGFITLEGENGQPRRDVSLENARIETLGELFNEIPAQEKIIVWATFKENYKAIMGLCDKMGISYQTLTGDDSAKDKDNAVRDFMDPAGCRVLIANPAAGGVGVSLTISSFSIHFSRSFSLEHDIQSESRNHRAGSEIHEKVTRIDLITPNSIDEFVAKRLFQKQALSDKILLNYLKEGL